MKKFIAIFLMTALAAWGISCRAAKAANGGMSIVKNGKPVARIVVDHGDTVNVQAARLLQDFVMRLAVLHCRLPMELSARAIS